MPRSMFQDVVCPHGDSLRKWYTLPVSFVVHTAILIVFVVIPLLAADALPTPRLMTVFVNPVSAPAPPPPAVPRHVSVQPAQSENSTAAPIEAPQGITREPDLLPEPPQAGLGVTGVIEGLGNGFSVEPAPLPPPPAVVRPVRLSSGITPPRRIKDVPPVYPSMAQSVRVQGDVIIEATIGPDGKVEDAHVLRSVPLLDQAAVAAVLGWVYTPTLLNGQPVPIIMTVTVRFRLQ
jgi:TonB family protein